MAGRDALRISKDEIDRAFASGDWSTRYPPIMTIDEAAEMLRIPKATLYAWRSAGRLKSCSQRMGKHVRFFRDRLVATVMNEGV